MTYNCIISRENCHPKQFLQNFCNCFFFLFSYMKCQIIQVSPKKSDRKKKKSHTLYVVFIPWSAHGKLWDKLNLF